MPDSIRETVLVVEDDDTLREMLRLHLQHEGYRVLTAADGPAGLSAARTAAPDLVLLDVMMPGMDGFEVLHSLRSSFRTRYLPVILLTALSQTRDRIRGLELGANDFISKPYVANELALRVRILLNWTRGVRDMSPLTGLPGTASIEQEASRRIARGEHFGYLYIDLNSFKAFNDYYGHARGDLAIRATAEALGAALESLGRESHFLGHVGGDDFVIITDPEVVEPMGEAAIREFEARVPALYDPEDRARGYIEVANRRGQMERFDLLTVTVVGVSTDQVEARRYSELSDRVAELKRHGKTKQTNVLVTERRHAEELANRAAS